MNATRVFVVACLVLVALAAAPAVFAQTVPDVPSGGMVAPTPVGDGGNAGSAVAPILAPATGRLPAGIPTGFTDALARWWAARTFAPTRVPAAQVTAGRRTSVRAGNRAPQGVR
jgi:hypothetical protein